MAGVEYKNSFFPDDFAADSIDETEHAYCEARFFRSVGVEMLNFKLLIECLAMPFPHGDGEYECYSGADDQMVNKRYLLITLFSSEVSEFRVDDSFEHVLVEDFFHVAKFCY